MTICYKCGKELRHFFYSNLLGNHLCPDCFEEDYAKNQIGKQISKAREQYQNNKYTRYNNAQGNNRRNRRWKNEGI